MLKVNKCRTKHKKKKKNIWENSNGSPTVSVIRPTYTFALDAKVLGSIPRGTTYLVPPGGSLLNYLCC